MKRTNAITRKLYIEELERPAAALEKNPPATTLAIGEEAGVTTLALGEEACKTD
jgi:hypothetical protein